jgi:hypothetical protein
MSILFCAMTHYFTPIDYNEFGDDPNIISLYFQGYEKAFQAKIDKGREESV